jgi:hypothetical protein
VIIFLKIFAMNPNVSVNGTTPPMYINDPADYNPEAPPGNIANKIISMRVYETAT